jgi:hypothetical protein
MKKKFAIALSTLCLAASAQAADQYIFGFSGTNAGNNILINGTQAVTFADEGWYFQNGTHDTNNTNYIVGQCTSCGLSGEYRNWFAINLAGITAPVTSLALTLYSYDVTLTSGNYYLNDFTGSVSSLIGGTGGVAAFNDLGTGTNYGFHFYQAAQSNTFQSIALDSAAIDSLNAAIRSGASQWALGGSFSAGDVPLPPPPVPEPETYALMLLGLGALGIAARRRRA